MRPTTDDLKALAKEASKDRAAANAKDVSAALSLSGEVYELRGIRLGQPNFLTFCLLQALDNPLARLFREATANDVEVNWAVLPLVLAVIELTTSPDRPLSGLPEQDKIRVVRQRADEIMMMVPMSDIPGFITEALPALMALLKPLIDLADKGGQSSGEKFPAGENDRPADEGSKVAPGGADVSPAGGPEGVDYG